MRPNNLPKGKLGEDIATTYLTKKGYRVITRNFHSRFGEIDIIATHKNTLVFVEVKTRTGTPFGTPAEAVTPWKIRTIVATADYFIFSHPDLPKGLRVDVIAIQLDSGDKLLHLEHIENITG